MENYALSIANYFIDLANNSGRIIRPLKLMKLVYIAHGYMLALLDRPTKGTKLEKVEAWKYGPVFPSVYYSFKGYGKRPITKKTEDIDFSSISGSGEFSLVTPMLEKKEEKEICDFVWNTYGKYTDTSLVNILHAEGTPWKKTYKENGQNAIIPDALTKQHYQEVIRKTLENAKKQ